MKRRYRLTQLAHSDLLAIATSIGEHSHSAAESVLDKLFETFQLLADNPQAGTLRSDLANDLRVFCPRKPASNYLVFYFPIEMGVAVVGVIHGARDWLPIFESGERNREAE